MTNCWQITAILVTQYPKCISVLQEMWVFFTVFKTESSLKYISLLELTQIEIYIFLET